MTISLEIRDRAPLISKNGLAFQAYKPFLDAFQSYTTALSNFFKQSIHVMVTNPLFGRSAKDEATTARIREQAKQLGLQTDMVHISTYNLADAVKALPQLQREFRLLLGHFVADAELSQVECQEQQSFSYAWCLWYFFGAQPRRLVLHPQTLIGQATECIKRIRNALLRRLHALSGREVRVSITSEEVLWNSEPALWLTMDGKDAVIVYQTLEAVMQAIRQAVCKVPKTELRRYVLDFHWPYVVIVPRVRGKSLNATAWRLYLPTLLQEDELKWWNYFQSQIPTDAMTALGIPTWQDARLEPAFKYLASTTEMSLYAAHISDFLQMPEADEEGTAQLQTYLAQISRPLGTAFQSAIDAGSIIVSTFNELSPEEQSKRPQLISAIRALVEMQSSLLPTDTFQGPLHMTVTDIAEWAERLKRAREYGGLVYFFWVSDVLDIQDIKASV